MKKLFSASLLFLSLNSFAQGLPFSQTNVTVSCTTTQAVFDVLKKEFKESPVAVGKVDNLIVIIWKNLTTDAFTVTITSDEKNTNCSVLEGQELKILQNKPT